MLACLVIGLRQPLHEVLPAALHVGLVHHSLGLQGVFVQLTNEVEGDLFLLNLVLRRNGTLRRCYCILLIILYLAHKLPTSRGLVQLFNIILRLPSRKPNISDHRTK